MVLLVGGVAVLAAWFSSAASTVSVEPGLPARDSGADGPGIGGASAVAVMRLEHEVSRLSARLESVPRPSAPGRNPFMLAVPQNLVSELGRFDQANGRPVSGDVTVGDIARSVRRPSPTVSLFGMAVEDTAVGQRKTAMLSVGGRVVFATIGDEFAGRYQVRSVTADTVELFDTQLGTSMRLTLR